VNADTPYRATNAADAADNAADDVVVVVVSAPDAVVAGAIADAVVDEGVAACVNIVAGVTSVYRWKGAVERAQEHLLMIKTTRARYPALQTVVMRLHPYEVPECLALPVAAGLPAYMSWVRDAVSL
jgi:periplasmic divalent cation tolerance protein